MQRRLALALALAFTIVTTFSIVTVGARTGLFGDDDSAAAVEEYTETVPVADVPVEQPVQPAYAAPADPIVVTEYVYVDEEIPASQPRAQSASAPKPTTAAKKQPTAAPAEEEAAPAEEPTAPPAAAPTLPPAAPTSPPATAPTSVPTSPPPPPSAPPPAAAPAGPSELEFTGTVTAISGDIVTFSHGGTTTDVRVTRGLDELDIGTSATVHAIKVSTGYVAKEIEIKGGD